MSGEGILFGPRWQAGTFEIAMPYGPARRSGYVYRGLGLHVVNKGSPKGKRPPRWTLTHLGSGHALCWLDGDVATAFTVATEIAEAGDWDFLSLQGWKDRFPDAPDRLREILDRHPKVARRGGHGAHPNGHEVARQIANNRP